MISRRQFTAGAISVLGAVSLPDMRVASAQLNEPSGKIAFIENGDVWQWSSEDGTNRVVEDGDAMDPTWDPNGNSLLYARDGGSFSNLIMVNTRTGSRSRLTENEGMGEDGSPDYVGTSVWSIDPYWSQADIVCYISDSGSEYGEMRLWVFDPASGNTYIAADDGQDQGPPEHVSVDAEAIYCVYTVFSAGGSEGGLTYISMRDLNIGTTYPIIEGAQGAYAPAISPDGERIAASLRDENGVSDLWLFHRERETLTRLTDGEEVVNSVWSPDGEWVAYLKRNGTRFELWAMPIDVDADEAGGEARELVSDKDIDSTSGISWAQL